MTGSTTGFEDESSSSFTRPGALPEPHPNRGQLQQHLLVPLLMKLRPNL